MRQYDLRSSPTHVFVDIRIESGRNHHTASSSSQHIRRRFFSIFFFQHMQESFRFPETHGVYHRPGRIYYPQFQDIAVLSQNLPA